MSTIMRSEMPNEDFLIFCLSHVDTIGCETIKRICGDDIGINDLNHMCFNELKSQLQLRDSQAQGIIQMMKNMKDIEKEYEYLFQSDIKFITYYDKRFPTRLRDIKQSPAAIFVYGELIPDNEPSVAIVGSRACTSYGASVAKYFGEVLANNGIGVISGMAVGIDTAAHNGALSVNNGKTYAVLAGGVNVVYPKENRYIYDEIIRNRKGGIISESLPGKAAIARNFPMRNRIISGLSDIVLVVETREKSGSLITVDYAKEQNKTIMAIPGRVTDPMSKGTNKLISEGIYIANSPEDILKIFEIKGKENLRNNDQKIKLLDKEEKIVYSTLVSDPKHIEIILHESGLSGSLVMKALMSLELKGLANQISSNYYVSN